MCCGLIAPFFGGRWVLVIAAGAGLLRRFRGWESYGPGVSWGDALGRFWRRGMEGAGEHGALGVAVWWY